MKNNSLLPGLLLRSILLALLLLAVVPPRLFAAEPVEVRVVGLEGDPLKNVISALALPAGLVKDGSVDKLWLDYFNRQAESKVRLALEPFGYYGSLVTTALEEKKEGGYTLLVTVTAGEMVRLGEVAVKIEGDGSAEPLLLEKAATFPLRTGDQLQHDLYEKAKSEILSTSRELGYLDAHFSTHEILVDPKTVSARIHLILASGSRYLFGTTTISGATYYPDELLRRYIPFKVGEPFSYKAVGITQLNFTSSPYFKSVSVVPDKAAATALQVPVIITVVPAPRLTIRPGIGYGTDTGARASVGFKHLSLFAPGNTFTSEIAVAERLQGIGSAYTIPSDQNIETFSTIQLNLQREKGTDTVSKLAYLEPGRTTGFGEKRLGTASVRLMYEEYSVGLEGKSTSLLLLPGIRFSQHDYDDLIRPAKGWHYSLETRGAHRMVISDASFIQFIADCGVIVPLPWRLSAKSRVKGATTVINDPFTSVPSSLRFFAGGDSSVRGYAYKSLGPKDATGDVVGGKHLLQGSMELQRALFDNWAVSLFYDTGNAFDDVANFKLYQGVGIGIHYGTPIGALNLNLARQIGVPDPRFRIHFTIGFQL
ncbi:MAG TPA: outer membrane protein assembly factor [Desulfuromonadales bacterium]|nr:outer membrane protein assembly factor [Desulfuromonadales bacterium]